MVSSVRRIKTLSVVTVVLERFPLKLLCDGTSESKVFHRQFVAEFLLYKRISGHSSFRTDCFP